jgi:hypothetical protein
MKNKCVGFSLLLFITSKFLLISYKPDVLWKKVLVFSIYVSIYYFKLEIYAILVEFDKFGLGFK